MNSLNKEIEILINLKQEGAYWDFKRNWYMKDKTGDLLHDIICMANNLENRDAYIIIGVDEDNDFDIVGVREDENRKNTQKIVDFLKNKKFAGGIRPIVSVKTLAFSEKQVDVIVVKNKNNTPYYLEEKYRDVQAYQIYTRIQDTNTPKNSNADIDKIEWLWKKRFGLQLSPLEKVEKFIEDVENWIDSPYGEIEKYYKLFPEFTLRHDDVEDGRDGYEYYLFSQTDSRPHWKDIKIYYHQTLLMELLGVSLDGGRYMTPCPQTDGLQIESIIDWDVSYKYMIKNSFEYKLNCFLYSHKYTEEARISRKDFFSCILLFDDQEEHDQFKKYAIKNWYKRAEYLNSIHVPHIPSNLGRGYIENAFIKDYEDALILKQMLEEFRSE